MLISLSLVPLNVSFRDPKIWLCSRVSCNEGDPPFGQTSARQNIEPGGGLLLHLCILSIRESGGGYFGVRGKRECRYPGVS